MHYGMCITKSSICHLESVRSTSTSVGAARCGGLGARPPLPHLPPLPPRRRLGLATMGTSSSIPPVALASGPSQPSQSGPRAFAAAAEALHQSGHSPVAAAAATANGPAPPPDGPAAALAAAAARKAVWPPRHPPAPKAAPATAVVP